MNQSTYIPVRKSQINYYKNISLYSKSGRDEYVLYKSAGMSLDNWRLNKDRHPLLFINQDDRITAIKELQKEFNEHLKKKFYSGDIVEVKKILCDLVEETLSEPRSGILQVLPETIEILVSEYSKHPNVFKTLASISFKDYTTVIHAVNVMALTMGFCFYCNSSIEETKKIGLSALLHDVGKTEIATEILTAERKLSDEEFKLIKKHTIIGYNIIKVNGIDDSIAIGALEHHEKLDGSGYPKGVTNISFIGQLLGIIDSYEALTNEDRPYRRAKKPFEALTLLKGEVEAGKLNRKIFEKFCCCLI